MIRSKYRSPACVLLGFVGGIVFLRLGLGAVDTHAPLKADGFILTDEAGKEYGGLSIWEGGSWLNLKLPDGSAHARAGCMKTGEMLMELRGKDTAVSLHVGAKGSAGIHVNSDQQSAELSIMGDGSLMATATDTNGRQIIELIIGPDGTPSLKMKDAQKKTLWKAP